MNISKKNEENNRYYQNFYSSHTLFRKGSWIEKPEERLIQLVKDHLVTKKNVRVLDLGGGVGRNAIPIAQLIASNGGIVECVDFIPMSIEKLREYSKNYGVEKTVVGIVGDAETYPVTKHHYDLIISCSVLMHFSSKTTIISAMDRMRDGTVRDGFNYISIGTDITELDTKTNTLMEPDTETPLTSEEAIIMIKKVYQKWQLISLSVENYKEQYEKKGTEVLWNANFVIAIFRNNSL